MLLKGFFCLLTIGFTLARLDREGCGISKNRKPRIVGGKHAEAGEYPWMVSIEGVINDELQHVCGGSILNEYFIVTAAHCVPEPGEHLEVYVGLYSKNMKNDKYVQKHKISKVIIHPHYDPASQISDIALFKTKYPIDIDGSEGYVNSICLPEFDSPYPTGNATVIGWGCTGYEDNEYPDVLQEVVVPIYPDNMCHQDESSKGTWICAGGGGKNACSGDSGGPLFQFDEEGVATLIGIASLSPHDKNVSKPATFTKVAAFLNWMSDKMT